MSDNNAINAAIRGAGSRGRVDTPGASSPNAAINDAIRGRRPNAEPPASPASPDERQLVQERRTLRAAHLVAGGMAEAEAMLQAEESIPMPRLAPADYGGGPRGASAVTGGHVGGTDLIREGVARVRVNGGSVKLGDVERDLKHGGRRLT